MKQKYNHLGGAQQHKLNMYIEKNRELATEASDYSVAVKASQELGYPVTENNIRGAREAVGIKKRLTKVFKSNASSYIAKELVQLLIELGKQPSEILQQIADRRRMEVTET
jgi:hypothetical protein